MARIKYVINERRLAYEGAVRIHEERRQVALEKRRARQEAAKEVEAKKIAKEEKAAERVGGESDKAAELAAAALFDTVGVSQGSGARGDKA